MFALSFTKLALARIQQAKQIKSERKPSGKSAPQSLVPAIARRGLVALAIIAFAGGSAYARTGGGGSGGGGFGGGSSMFRGSNNNGSNSNINRPVQNTQPVQNNTPVLNSSNIQKTQTNLNVKPVDLQQNQQVKTFDKHNGNPIGDGSSRHTDVIKNVDATKLTGNEKPLNLDKKIEAPKNLDAPKNLNVNKNLNKNVDLAQKIKPNGNSGIIANGGPHGLNKSLNTKFVDAVKNGKLDSLTNGSAARKIGLGDQFRLMDKGNVASKLKLSDKLAKNGGWQKRMCGPIDSHYCDHCKGKFYCGPSWCPHHCWCPNWCGWVAWSFGCPMSFDPRPDFCEPISCDDCVVDEPVVINRDGNPDSWIDDQPQPRDAQPGPDGQPVADDQPGPDGRPPREAGDVDVDLELVAIRFVDNGNAEKNIGPRYRVIIRNIGTQPVDHPFNVAAIVGPGSSENERTPRAGKRVRGIDAGQTLAVDIRLPIEANATVKNDEGHSVARFTKLGVMVDTRNEVEEATKENNGMGYDRNRIEMVDPAVFAADTKQATLGQSIDLAGEGLGPEAGQVLVRVGTLELQAEIEGWYDLGVRVKLPSLPVAGDAKAELVVVRGDGAAANPIGMTLVATQSAPPAPVEEN